MRERFRHEVSKAPALESGVKVDMVLRSDAGHKGGGDLVQAEKYAEELRALGVDVRLVPFSVGFAPRGGAIVHAFNTDRPCELRHLMRIVAPERMVVSPVHHSSRLSRRMRAAERGGSVRDEVGARLPERVRVFALYAARVVRDLDASVWDRARAVAFAGADLLKPRGSLGRQLQGVRAVLLLSQRERDEMAVDLGYRGANHVTVPNGLESLGAPLLPWAQRERRVVVVGRIEPRKRQVEVLEAANRLGVPLTFVGAPNDGRPQYMARFRDALAAGPSEWVGALPREDVLGLMGRSRVLLNLSWVEVQSLVDLEGAAAGCYVVTSAAGSTKEWLGDLVDEFPVAELDAAVERAHELSQVSHSPAPFDYVHTWASAANRLRAVYRGGAAPSAVVAE